MFSSALWVISKYANLYFSDQAACFPSTVKVNLKHGKVVKMSELKIGDQIQTGSNIEEYHFILTFLNSKIQEMNYSHIFQRNFLIICLFFVIVIFCGCDFVISYKVSASGKVIHSKVVAFFKKLPNMITQYKSITTFGNESLIVSGDHLVYAKVSLADQFKPM